MVVESTAEQVLKQQPGVSIITRDDIQKNPPVNDLADIIRKMHRVNLTGNSASGRAEITDKLIFVVWGRKIP